MPTRSAAAVRVTVGAGGGQRHSRRGGGGGGDGHGGRPLQVPQLRAVAGGCGGAAGTAAPRRWQAAAVACERGCDPPRLGGGG